MQEHFNSASQNQTQDRQQDRSQGRQQARLGAAAEPLPKTNANAQKFAHIAGWGADLDHANRPAYPKERMPQRLQGIHWEHPEQQAQHVEVLHSSERPGITPIFGTTVPPSGLSGMLRGTAFRFSENDIRHWLILLLADRVNMFEGLGEDLARGHVPNVFAEMGGKSELQFNRAGAARKLLVVAAIAGASYYLATSSRRGHLRVRPR
jgi:hypothetical protein